MRIRRERRRRSRGGEGEGRRVLHILSKNFCDTDTKRFAFDRQ